MEQSSEELDFNLKEWAFKARITNSRRFSASNLKSFREDTKSFRSNNTISSCASSPGYTLREEIDPSKYSFTTALKALQAKNQVMYTYEYQSLDGLTLNSKWNEAEKYICNPLSGQVPLECLSAKTLSFRSSITKSAPLIYPSHIHQFHTRSTINEHKSELEITSKESKMGLTRDVGIQSTLEKLSSSSPSRAPTPSIEERSIKLSVGDSPVSSPKLKSETEADVQEEVKEMREKESRKRNGRERKKLQVMCRCRQGGCLSLRGLWMGTVKHRDNKNRRYQDDGTYLSLPK